MGPTNDVMGGYNLTGYSTTVIEGATIKIAGMCTGYVQTGTILDAHRDGTSSGRKYTDFFKVSVQVIGGDSGCAIWYPSSGYKNGTLIGTVKAEGSGYSIGGKIEHIIFDLQLDSTITY